MATIYTPEELATLFNALNSCPSFLSKRFVLKNMLGWTENDLSINMKLIEEEQSLKKIGNKGGY